MRKGDRSGGVVREREERRKEQRKEMREKERESERESQTRQEAGEREKGMKRLSEGRGIETRKSGNRSLLSTLSLHHPVHLRWRL